MMKSFYLLKMSLEGAAHQNELMQMFKSDGDDVIQTSSGLCVKTSKGEAELNKLLEGRGVSLSAVPKDPSPDIAAFMRGASNL